MSPAAVKDPIMISKIDEITKAVRARVEDNFKKYLEEDINLNAVITLPDEMFKNASQQKAIILITKKGQTRLPNQVFLAQIPSFQNKASYAKFIEEI